MGGSRGGNVGNCRSSLSLKVSLILSTDAARQPNVLGHDGRSLGMDGEQIGVLEEADQVRLRCFLKGQNCGSLEAETGIVFSEVCVVLCNLTHKPLKRQLAEDKLRGPLVSAYFAQCDSAGSVSLWLLYTTGGRRR